MSLIVGNSKIFADTGAAGQKLIFKWFNKKEVLCTVFAAFM